MTRLMLNASVGMRRCRVAQPRLCRVRLLMGGLPHHARLRLIVVQVAWHMWWGNV